MSVILAVGEASTTTEVTLKDYEFFQFAKDGQRLRTSLFVALRASIDSCLPGSARPFISFSQSGLRGKSCSPLPSAEGFHETGFQLSLRLSTRRG